MSAKPRTRVAIAFARNFAAGLVQNAEPGFQQESTNLTEAEMLIVQMEMLRISERIEATINQEMLAKAVGAGYADEDV